MRVFMSILHVSLFGFTREEGPFTPCQNGSIDCADQCGEHRVVFHPVDFGQKCGLVSRMASFQAASSRRSRRMSHSHGRIGSRSPAMSRRWVASVSAASNTALPM